uniref:EGF-like domain-containing protein n=1 Tax=Plectus sambesii TaxID=2011161 RepID=A0A914VLW4_9BILA
MTVTFLLVSAVLASGHLLPIQSEAITTTDVCAKLQPCKNGGTCRPDNTSELYSCKCPENTTGSMCETLLTCTSQSCPKLSLCYVFNHQIVCKCRLGYIKDADGECEPYYECDAHQPCINGGSCEHRVSMDDERRTDVYW